MNKKLSIIALIFIPYQVYASSFIDDGKISLNLSNMYINNKFDTPIINSDTHKYSSRNEEWAQGYNLIYKSGYTDGTIGFAVEATANGGFKLMGNADHHTGGTMIPTDGSSGDGVTSWGRLLGAVKLKYSNTELKYGNNLEYKLPIVVSNTARITPQYFQGVDLTSTEFKKTVLKAGYLTKAVGRWSTDRTGLAIAGGTTPSKGFYFAGVDYKFTPELTGQYYISQLQDYYTQQFLGAKWQLPLSPTSSFETEIRYFNSRSDGKNGSVGYKASGYTRNNDGKIDNDTWSITSSYKYGYHNFLIGYQQVSGGSLMPTLNQASLKDKDASGVNYYLYSDRMFYNFTRAGEKTTYGQYTYDFKGLNIPGLVFKFMYLKGVDIKQRGLSSAKEFERDISLGYIFQSKPLKGLSVEWRNGLSKTNNIYDSTSGNNRNWLILNYTFNF
ncbi:MAG: OprD family outer membrane porin [Acinetobacter sp.]